jgi:uncharacterized membrane protein
MNWLAKTFLKGLLVVVPIAVTAYVVWFVVSTVDGWLPIPIPGAGLVITALFILLVGFVASKAVGRKAFDVLERGLKRVPVVKLLYSSLRDLLNAFVGDKRSFDRPVVVELMPEQGVKVLGFVTCTRFADVKLVGHVAVYVPQSYNFAGMLLIVPKERVHPIDADGAACMAFVVSGGVAEMSAARTILDTPIFSQRGK